MAGAALDSPLLDAKRTKMSRLPQIAVLVSLVAGMLLVICIWNGGGALDRPQIRGGHDHSSAHASQSKNGGGAAHTSVVAREGSEGERDATVPPAKSEPSTPQQQAPAEVKPRDDHGAADSRADGSEEHHGRHGAATESESKPEPRSTQHQAPTAAELRDDPTKAEHYAEKHREHRSHHRASKQDGSATQPSHGKSGVERTATRDTSIKAQSDLGKPSEHDDHGVAEDKNIAKSTDNNRRGAEQVKSHAGEEQLASSTRQPPKTSQEDRRSREEKEDEVAERKTSKENASIKALTHHGGNKEQGKPKLSPKQEQREITAFEAKVIADGLLCMHGECDQGQCDQTGCFRPTCNGGGCTQVKTFEASCRGGKCSQADSMHAQCEGGSCL
mmetsp:Transcript_29780/g.74879  ORF Transcript_29780/g.74879 Transcript_29780/m.74879 type:complete len:387 (+) Transcript_29780:47-1207(+)|eukprot:CAMPEP_0115286258 /NCGR_PEP_ID=MMETSP0270-20121206/61852_1 /TAXON_ID=71861 /ORGANISM="Scrippsiella trochoidea, Strain CCMP3099" /LENGTH=386 /DNA_ID=CAMNT_0002703303 /DNA_START=54 /DNA_END=1214 /DNA_ORIENTATION=-